MGNKMYRSELTKNPCKKDVKHFEDPRLPAKKDPAPPAPPPPQGILQT